MVLGSYFYLLIVCLWRFSMLLDRLKAALEELGVILGKKPFGCLR